MINLLPHDIKTNYSYGRRNVGLRRWVVAFVLAFVGLGIIITFGLLTFRQQTERYSMRISQSEATLKKQKYTETQDQVKAISNNFKLVFQVLGNEVLFSKLIQQITASIPANTSLTNLDIDKASGSIDVSAVASDYTTATQVQVNLADPANKIFDKADIISIDCANAANKTSTGYSCKITLKAQFAPNNPFLFISDANRTAKS